jgi:hypothetical protein
LGVETVQVATEFDLGDETERVEHDLDALEQRRRRVEGFGLGGRNAGGGDGHLSWWWDQILEYNDSYDFLPEK